MNERRDFITKNWGEDVLKAIDSCKPLNITFGQFLDKCVACGGNWGGMLLSGLRKLRPEIWEAIPDDMGIYAWQCICDTLILAGVVMEEEEEG